MSKVTKLDGARPGTNPRRLPIPVGVSDVHDTDLTNALSGFSSKLQVLSIKVSDDHITNEHLGVGSLYTVYSLGALKNYMS